MGLVAVPPHLHLRKGTLQHGGLGPDELGHLGKEGPDPPGDGLPHEQVVQLREAACTVQVHDLHRVHLYPGPPEHVGLESRVPQVVGFDGGGGLDLDERVGLPRPGQDVHGHYNPVLGEGGLEDGGLAPVQRPAGGLHPLRHPIRGKVHEDPAGKAGSGRFLHSGSLVHDEAGSRIRHQLGSVGLVDFPPQELGALLPCGETGLGKKIAHSDVKITKMGVPNR
jgi:hypothetical protein